MSAELLHRNGQTPVFVRAGILQLLACCAVLALTLSCTEPVTRSSSTPEKAAQFSNQVQEPTSGRYEPSSRCRNCHSHIYTQFRESMHAKSYENPLFKAEFFNILLPWAENNKDLFKEAEGCIACHSPITFMQNIGDITGLMNVDQDLSGVECDFCHTVIGYKGSVPENGNYVSQPGAQKSGPFEYKSDHHRIYSELQTKSDVCAICHNRTNRYGLEIITTFSEWKESRYADQGIECQDCHMNVRGFLTAGKPVHESGIAAQAGLITPQEREKIYTHRFPGAHSESQVTGAIQLDIQIDETAVRPGEDMLVFVDVDNSRSGHKLPTGTAELRLVYLDLVADIDRKIIPLAANSLDKEMYDISGRGKFDAIILGNDIPHGRRVYRAICVDENDQQTMYSFDAAKISFDNRLEANEIRKEFFKFQVPENVGTEFLLIARLNYFRYPGSFAETLGVPEAKPVELAITRKKVVVNKQP